MKENNFWTGKKVLITGAMGFVGNALAKSLEGQGANIVALARGNKKSTQGPKLFKPAQVIESDLSSPEELKELLAKNKIEIVFHAAGFAIVSRAANEPLKALEDNFITTLNLLEACRLYGACQSIVLMSSDKAYGDHAGQDPEELPFRENYGLRGMDIYSASKVCADVLGQAYAFQYNLPVVIGRSCNIFGVGDTNFTRLIPKTAMSLLMGRPPTIKIGHEKVLREYLYIDDAVSAYKFLAEHTAEYYGPNFKNMPKKGKQTVGWPVFNIGSYSALELKNLQQCDKIKSVTDLVALLRLKISDIEPQFIEQPAEFIEIPDEYLDSTKIIELGFKGQVGIVEGLDKTITWYRENFENLKLYVK